MESTLYNIELFDIHGNPIRKWVTRAEIEQLVSSDEILPLGTIKDSVIYGWAYHRNNNAVVRKGNDVHIVLMVDRKYYKIKKKVYSLNDLVIH